MGVDFVDEFEGSIVFDLDGTMYDDRHRKHLLPDYEAYHSELLKDEPVEAIVFLLKAANALGVETIACTTRDDAFRGATEQKLRGDGLLFDAILMRPKGNYMKSPEMKQALLEKYYAGKGEEQLHHTTLAAHVGLMIDDRDDVVSHFRSLGVTCLQHEVAVAHD